MFVPHVVAGRSQSWDSTLAGPSRDVINWYFTEVPKVTDEVDVAEPENLAAAGPGGH
jgi:hypothetical protein